ncbi:MAG: glycoside hydrolase family 92 protein [Myxococcales bacterium]|nr:glycoside hydrolase family 92 protein [Myxococcales bacterium]
MLERIRVAASLFALAACSSPSAPPADSVDPFIGTGGSGFGQGNAFPGATAPFGMVKVGPDTAGNLGRLGFAHAAGYWREDALIEGFSHTHMHGTGIADYGNVLFMPTIGMDAGKTSEAGYRAGFSRSSEEARPGYFAVTLARRIRAELTASERAAHHRYSFPEGVEAVLIIDLSHGLGAGRILDSQVEIDRERSEISGWATSAGDFVGEAGAFTVYFAAALETPFSGHGVFQGTELRESESAASGREVGAYLRFPAASIEAKVGISYVDLEHARLNRDSELGGRTFEQTRARTEAAWNELLGTVEAVGGTEAERRTFYTALYHSLLMPTLFSDVDGSYRGLDRAVHRAPSRTYTDFSLWDTYRTQHPLLALLAPDRQAEMAGSLMAMREQGGILPRWPLAVHETSCMVGSPADIVLSESYQKGLRDFDAEGALESMVATASGPPPPGAKGSGRDGVAECLKAGYCPWDKVGGSVALTLEYAHADFAISELARALGRHGEAEEFGARAKAYRLLFDGQSRLFLPRSSSGAFSVPADPTQWSDHYVEGNPWHYLWMVPHDLPGLMELFGGREAMLERLDELFESAEAAGKAYLSGSGVRMPDPYYWHGNEPDIHAAYMYALAGRPDRGANWIRWVMQTRYSDGPDGLDGNDDAGTLSAWYVFSALGFYPVPGTDRYAVGAPLFPRATLRLPGGTFTIVARGASAETPYVREAILNGRRLREPWFFHRDLVRGGTLELEMGAEPSSWGIVEPR